MMNCPKCGRPNADGAAFCSACGWRLNGRVAPYAERPVPAQQAQPRPRSSQNTAIVIVAALLVLVILAGIYLILTGKGPKQGVVDGPIDTARRDSSENPLLAVYYAAYDTAFDSEGFSFTLDVGDKSVCRLKTDYGADLPSSGLYMTIRNVQSMALYDESFLRQKYGKGIRVNVRQVGDNLIDVMDFWYTRSQSRVRLPGGLPSDKARFVADMIRYSMGRYDNSRQPLADDVLGVVHDNKPDMEAIGRLYALAAGTLESELNLVEGSIPSMDAMFARAADFLATLPEDVVQYECAQEGDVRTYTFTLDWVDAGEALLDYVEKDETLNAFLNAYCKNKKGRSFRTIADEMRGKMNKARADGQDTTVPGEAVISGKYLRSCLFTLPDGREVRAVVTDVGTAEITQEDYRAVERAITRMGVTVDSADDLIRLSKIILI